MAKYFKFFEIAYLVIAIIFIVETFLRWNSDRNKAYIFLAFSIMAVFMYFFRKKYRKRFENQERKQ
jgi:positive regulator of sigma E activity